MTRLDQQRAAFALEKVESVRQHSARDKFRTQLVKFPARLHTNGLGQSVAFYLSAGPDSTEATICTWLEAWLQRAGIYPPDRRLIDCIVGQAPVGIEATQPESEASLPDPPVSGDQVAARYRQAAAESRLLATWLKRFAEAFLVPLEAAEAPGPGVDESGLEGAASDALRADDESELAEATRDTDSRTGE